MALGLGIADELACARYREYRRYECEEGKGDGRALELETHGGPEQRRHDDVGKGQVAAERESRDAKEDEPEDSGLRPSRRGKFRLAMPTLEHHQREGCHDQNAGGIPDPPEGPGAQEGLRKYPEP